MYGDPALDHSALQEFFAMLPASQQQRLVALVIDGSATPSQWEEAVREALSGLNWETDRARIGALLCRLMPLERLVPDIYAAWRPIVRDAVAFFASRLSAERLAPKIVEQIVQADHLSLEQRLLLLCARMPALQKIGQIVARDPELDPAFRQELTRLENSICDITPRDIHAELQQQLGDRLTKYSVEVQPLIVAEASVSAVLRFTWRNPITGRRERGVFKVLKPYVVDHFPEELHILHEFADFIDRNRDRYELPALAFRKVMDEVRCLLSDEINLPNEQAALDAAYGRYEHVPGVRVPRLIRELSTSRVTAMTEEQGVKVTDAFPNNPRRRRELAQRLVEVLVAEPLYAEEPDACFHADLHAGNLIVDEQTGEVIILDWALVERLGRQQRRDTVLLTLAIAWRDAQRAFEAVARLSEDDLHQDVAKAALVQREIAAMLSGLSPLSMPEYLQVISLLDRIALLGVHFPAALLMFRKTLFTLNGVLHDIAPDARIDPVVVRYVLRLLLLESPYRMLRLPTDSSATFRSHLANYDLTTLMLSLPLLGSRLYFQTIENATRRVMQELRPSQLSLSPAASTN